MVEQVESNRETLVFFKLASGTYDRFTEKLRSLHPYEVPEIVCVNISQGLPDYLRWLSESCAV